MSKQVNHVNLECKFLNKADEDAGIITGLGSKYGNTDHAGDVMMPGSFKKSIQEKGSKFFPILWQHSWNEPIGIINSIKEDNEGLKIQVKLNLDTQRGREAHSLAKMGALGGFSVGFYVKKFNITPDGTRQITEGALLEVSLVTFPCNEQAVIETVKSQFEGSAMKQPLVLAATKLNEALKTIQTVKVNKAEHSEVLSEILALITSAIGDANADADEDMFADSDADKELPVSDAAAEEDVSDDTSTEEEPEANEDDEFSEEEQKMLHSILNNLTQK